MKSILLAATCACIFGLIIACPVWAIPVTVTSNYVYVRANDPGTVWANDPSFITAVPGSDTVAATAGNSSSTSNINYSTTGPDNVTFSVDMSHSIDNTTGAGGGTIPFDYANTANTALFFTADVDTTYSISGFYSMLGPTGTRIVLDVYLYDVTADTYLLEDFQESRSTTDESFLLGAGVTGGGDFDNNTSGVLSGNLIANHDYEFFFNTYIESLGPSAETFVAATATGEIVLTVGTAGPVDLSGTIRTPDGTDICAMVLASGKFIFSCDPVGVFSLTDLAREQNGTVKRQIYADGFFPKIDILTGSSNDAVVLTQSGTCPSYNTPYDPAYVPGSAGKWINIAGKVLVQDSATPICAMVLANGQFMFSCDGTGNYALNIPLDSNGQFKLQVYADGFAPTIQTFDEFQASNDVRMAYAVECQ